MAVKGLFGPYLIRVLGYKNVTIIGTLMVCTGLAASSFVNNVILLFPCYAILPGIGLGLQMFAAILVNQYQFEKHITLVFGVVSSGASVGTFVFGFVIEHFLRTYGWRGTLLMLSAIVFHAVPMAMCMSVDPKHRTSKEIQGSNDKIQSSLEFVKKTQIDEQFHTTQRGKLSCCIQKVTIYSKLFKNKIYLGTLVLALCLNFGGSAVGVFLPHFVKTRYGESVYSISSISILGAGDLCGRISAGIFGNWVPINKLLMINIETTLMGISTLMIPFCTRYIELLACTFVTGCGIGFFVSVLPSTCVDLFGVKNLNRTYGTAAPFIGLAFLLSAPFHAFLINTFGGDIDVVFISSAIFCFTTAITALLTYICFRAQRVHKKQTKMNTPETTKKQTDGYLLLQLTRRDTVIKSPSKECRL